VVEEGEGAREVGEEDERSLERADEQRLAARVVGGDLLGQLGDASRDLLCREVDLPDGLDVVPRPGGRAQEASFRPYR
jgi:hypothetical protein